MTQKYLDYQLVIGVKTAILNVNGIKLALISWYSPDGCEKINGFGYGLFD